MRTARSLTRPAISPDAAHRLHPSSRRRSLETSTERRAPVLAQRGTGPVSPSRDTRPPPSMRGFSHIPPSIELRPVPTGSLPGALYTQRAAGSSSLRNSTTSLPGTSGQQSASAPATPASMFSLEPEYPLSNSVSQNPESDVMPSTEPFTTSFRMPSSKNGDRRTPRTARFSELERIESHPESIRADYPRMDPSQPPVITHEQMINVFPEPAQPVEPAPPATGGRKKLIKGGGKLVKKSRWSGSKPPAITA